MKESILEVKNLHFAYDEHHTVLDGISLSVFAGERIAILGSNGAGKSTFFLNLNGVLTPAEGEISYRGTKITRKTLKKLRQHIGIVFQDADNNFIGNECSRIHKALSLKSALSTVFNSGSEDVSC